MTTLDDADRAPDADLAPNADLAPDATPRPMRKDAARNRALLIEAGRDVFARRGLEASLDEVARQAGVGVGTAYRHFGNKFELAAAIMSEGIAKVRELAVRATESADPWGGLVAFVEAVLELQAEDRGLREVTMGVHDPAKFDEVHDLIAGPVTALFDRAKAAGAVRPEAEATDLAFIITMLCMAADVAAASESGMWRRFLPTLLAGLRPDGPDLPLRPLTDIEWRTGSACYYAQAMRAHQSTPHAD